MIITSFFDIAVNENITSKEFSKQIENLFYDTFIDKVNKDFIRYKLKREIEITKENNRLFKHFTFLIMFYNEIIENINAKYKLDNNSFIKYRINTCEKLYLKSIQLCIDMLSLFEKGALVSSFLLWRSIYNDYVITKYLLQSGEEISECYNEFAKVQKYIILKDKSVLSDEEIKKYKEKYGNLNNNFAWAINIKGLKNFMIIQNKVKEKKYCKEYKFSSMYHHASSFSVNNSIFYGDEDYGNTNMPGFFSGNIEIPYNLTVSLMKDFTDAMINFFLNDEKGKLILALNALLESKFVIPKELG
jgi:hypothetical protein